MMLSPVRGVALCSVPLLFVPLPSLFPLRQVIYFTDPVDEYLMQNLTEYEEKKFQNASKEDLKIGTKKERESQKALKDSFKDLTAWWKKQLGSDVEAVKVCGAPMHHPPWTLLDPCEPVPWFVC